MFIYLGILALVGGAVGLLSYVLVPAGVDRFYTTQKDRADGATKQLDDLYIWVKKRKILYAYIAFPVALAILGFFLFQLVGVVVGAALGLLVPTFILRQQKAKRRRLLRYQLVDTLMTMSGALKAGLSLNQALEAVVDVMPAPVSQEFSYILKEVYMGKALDVALYNFKQRVKMDEADLIVTSILVVRDTGGNLTETFSQLVYTIRESQKLEGKVKVLTTQARLQAIIMSILPLAFAAFLYIKSRDLLMNVLNMTRNGVPVGKILFFGAFFWWLIGVYFIIKFSKVEV